MPVVVRFAQLQVDERKNMSFSYARTTRELCAHKRKKSNFQNILARHIKQILLSDRLHH